MGNPFVIAEDLALKQHLAGLTVADEKNASRQVKVWFGYPDIEVRNQEYPFITIDLLDITHALDRQHQGILYDSDQQGTNPTLGHYKYDYPTAYDLSYQITTHSRHPRHDRALIWELHNKFPARYGYLRVPNELGTEYSYRSMFLDGFVKRDAVEEDSGGRRLLRSVFTIRVVSEMTPKQAANRIPEVLQVDINPTITNIPSGFTPVQ